MIRVIFLDIDGVLNSEDLAHKRIKQKIKEYENGVYNFIDDDMVKMLADLCEKYKIFIIISSSWRKNTSAETKEFFKRDDMKKLHPLVPYIWGSTPKLGFEIDRGFEIEKYLMDNPDIKEYVILDDDNDMLECQEEHFIQTSWLHGLTEEHIPQIKKILKISDTK